VLDRVENGVIHFDDGGTLPLPAGVSAEWVSDPWYTGWEFRTPAAREGRGMPVLVTNRTARPERELVERCMRWLSEQESVRGFAG
jgi:hypothetical protein